MSCEKGFDGNSDIYGLGIRLGIFLQWLTSIFAENFHHSAIEAARDTNSTYQLAMVCGFMFITFNPTDDFRAVEGYVALLFCFAGMCVASLQNGSSTQQVFLKSDNNNNNNNNNNNKEPPRRLRTAGDMILSTLICCHGTWFIYKGMDDLQRTECEELAFFFAPVSLFGWFRSVTKAVFALGLATSTVMLLVQAFVVATWMPSTIDDCIRKRIHRQHAGPDEQPFCRTVRVSMRQLFASLAALGLFVAAVETTLIWNRITGVRRCDDFSQLFPLMIAVTNLTRVTGQFLVLYVKAELELKWTWRKER